MSGGKNILMWFRADLRLTDNPALHRAAMDGAHVGGAVVGAFIICPGQWREHAWAAIKVDFILRSLAALSEDLGARNIPLIIAEAKTFADVPRVIARVAAAHGCGAIYWNKEYEVNEARRDAAVQAACAKESICTAEFTDQVLVEPGGVRTGEGKFFTVFTPFRRALYRTIKERGGVGTLVRPRRQAPTGIAATPVPNAVEGFATSVTDAVEMWPAGESHAHRRLKCFVERQLAGYESTRNNPAIDGTSGLSPYLTVGAISARQCVAAAVEANKGKLEGGRPGADCWISELAWREFYRHILVGYPRVSMGRAFRLGTERIRWKNNPDHFRAWCQGRTGVPIVDAGMRCLASTGWMHNRARMITAMYLTKDLLTDWRWGERWFMSHLIDGDLASNNGGWQWSASTGTDAAPYFRIFNPVSQSRACDPSGEYIRRWIPELSTLDGGPKGAVHDPSVLPPLMRSSLHYPHPIVDHALARDAAIRAFRAL